MAVVVGREERKVARETELAKRMCDVRIPGVEGRGWPSGKVRSICPREWGHRVFWGNKSCSERPDLLGEGLGDSLQVPLHLPGNHHLRAEVTAWMKGCLMQAQCEGHVSGTIRELFQVSGSWFPRCIFIGGIEPKWKLVNLTPEAAYSGCKIEEPTSLVCQWHHKSCVHSADNDRTLWARLRARLGGSTV